MSLALFLLAAISADAPTPDERQAMTRCFARASLEQPWRARSADALAADPAFAEHLSHRCHPEIVPLYPRAYEMAEGQLPSGGAHAADRIPLARANMVRIIADMLPEAMRSRGAPPRMTAREQRIEFTRWLLDGSTSDPTSYSSRLLETSQCLGGVGEGRATEAEQCALAKLMADVEAGFAARYPEADPVLTAALIRGIMPMSVVFATITPSGPAPRGSGKRE